MLLILQIYTCGPRPYYIGLRKIPFYINFHVCIDTAVNTPVYTILTPNEYYTELPALAINGLLISQGLPHQLRTLHRLSNGIYIAQCTIYTLLRCSMMTVLSLRKKFFYILG